MKCKERLTSWKVASEITVDYFLGRLNRDDEPRRESTKGGLSLVRSLKFGRGQFKISIH